ncbi:MAG: peroxiredoxin [Nitrospinota bacterium]
MAVKVGDLAPDFELPRTRDQKVKLSDYRGKKNVLLAFYPFDFSPVCSEQLPSYQANYERFQKKDCEVIGISVDSSFAHEGWAERYGIQFPLLSDFFGKEACKRYGVLREEGFSNRAVFLVDRQGRVVYKEVTPAPTTQPDFEKLMEAVEKL